MSYIKEKVVAITGTGSGFGRLVACKAAARGARIVGCDVNEAELSNTVDMVTSAGGQMHGVRADVRDPADMPDLLQYSLIGGAVDATRDPFEGDTA